MITDTIAVVMTALLATVWGIVPYYPRQLQIIAVGLGCIAISDGCPPTW